MYTAGDKEFKMDSRDDEELRVRCPKPPLNIKSLSQLRAPIHFPNDSPTLDNIRQALEESRAKPGRLVEELAVTAHFHKWQMDQIMCDVDKLKRAGCSKPSGKVADFVKLLSAECQAYRPHEQPTHLARHINEESDTQLDHKVFRNSVWDDHSHEWLLANKTWGKMSAEVQADICQRLFEGITKWPYQVSVVRTTEEISKSRKRDKRGGKPDTSRRKNKVQIRTCTHSMCT